MQFCRFTIKNHLFHLDQSVAKSVKVQKHRLLRLNYNFHRESCVILNLRIFLGNLTFPKYWDFYSNKIFSKKSNIPRP